MEQNQNNASNQGASQPNMNNQPSGGGQPQQQPPKPTPPPAPAPTPAPAPAPKPAGEKPKSKNGWISAVIIIVVIALLIVVPRLKNSSVKDDVVTGDDASESVISGCEDGTEFNTETGEPCPAASETETDTETTTQSPASATESSGYQATLQEYTGRVILLGASCAPSEKERTFAVGSKIMIANHSTETQAVSFQSRAVTLEPYHYMLGFLNTAGKYDISCGKDKVATITVK